MSVRPKYKAKPVVWNSNTCSVESPETIEQFRVRERFKLPSHIWRFDSQHEFKVYLELKRMYGEHKISRQVPVLVIAPGFSYPKGKTWKVDFVISSGAEGVKPFLYVEAKGAFLTEFALILGILEEYQFDVFRKLKIIFPERLPVGNKVVKALLESDFRKNLLTLKELEKFRVLP
ncbi:hypothetical protein [Pleurocapsa sp. FMAR1]|uniref:hypothetical protein n=1 Tax=Pleurocapsa sp. FMAR1 TaxID=3040204 RepID=UPI0029C90D36|nr:hypothetical protein [Pleurocapsa sp. FMAR1]